MRYIRAHLSAWLFGLGFRVMPPHPYKNALAFTMAEHGRTWWAHWRAEGGE